MNLDSSGMSGAKIIDTVDSFTVLCDAIRSTSLSE